MQNYMQNPNIKYGNNCTNIAQQPPGQCYVPPLPSQYQIPPAQNPNYAGVNIQIINPMVNPASGYTYPQQTASAYDTGVNGGCYPAGYYTSQPGAQIAYPPKNQVRTNQQGVTGPQSGFYDTYGNYYPYIKDNNGNIGYYDQNGKFQPLDPKVGKPSGEDISTKGDSDIIEQKKSNGPQEKIETDKIDTTSENDTKNTETQPKQDEPSLEAEKDNKKDTTNDGKNDISEDGKIAIEKDSTKEQDLSGLLKKTRDIPEMREETKLYLIVFRKTTEK